MELLVAIMIATIMAGVALYVFTSVQRGTRISLARAEMVTAATTVDARLRQDAAAMIGPSVPTGTRGGCMVIIPALREGYLPTVVAGKLTNKPVRLRSDQLVFLTRSATTSSRPWHSVLPTNQNEAPLTGAPTTTTSWEGRAWIGAIRDGNIPPGDGSPLDTSLHAHKWMVGRQMKLLVDTDDDLATPPSDVVEPDLTPTPTSDTTVGTLLGFRAAATAAGGWSDAQYVSKTAVSPDSTLNYTNMPVVTPQIDLRKLQLGIVPSGVQLADLSASHMRLLENCSEIIVQWAGDLDKDGKVDTYPANHPLAGSIIWYPEELHDKGAWYNGVAPSRLNGNILAKYNQIRTHDWALNDKAFPSGFAPAMGAWPNGRFGAAPAGGWRKRFEFDYGEQDNPGGQTTAPASNIPAPYVFRVDDGQYRLVRHGFRQDGSVYANAWDGAALPANTDPAPPAPFTPKAVQTDQHWFPYPPLSAAPTVTAPPGLTSGDPMARTLYAGVAAPAGPYPRSATAAVAAGRNFGDLMGAQVICPADAMVGVNVNSTGPNGERYRTGGNGIPGDPNQYGQWVRVQAWPVLERLTWPVPAPTLTLTTPSGGSAPVAPEIYSPEQINALQNAPVWPYYSGGNLVIYRQADTATVASVPKPAGDPTADTTPFPSVVNPVGPMSQMYGQGNNYTRNYTDLYAEYLRTVNHNRKAGTVEDWRNPQSDWPNLVRLRIRLHDSQGLITSYSDEFQFNGRDDDGDGVVDNKGEGRISGLWFEHIVAVPYPMDPSPRNH